MTAKKRKPLSKRKQAAANKKRAETLRLKKLAKELGKTEKFIGNAEIVVGLPKGSGHSHLDRRPLRKSSKQERIDKLEAELALAKSDLETLKAISHFTPVRPQEFLHLDGTLALMPSRLRHIAETKKLRAALKKLDPDSPEFDTMARDVAEYYDVELQEVYTLFWSP